MKNFLVTFSISFLFFSSFFSQTVIEKEFLDSNFETCDSLKAKYYRIIEKKQNYSTDAIITYFNIDGIKNWQGEYYFKEVWKKNGHFNYYDSAGRIKSKNKYVYDNLNGPFYHYFENGNIKIKGTYLINKYNDSLFTYFESGSLRRIDLYKSGLFISGKCFTSEGKDTLHYSFEKEAEFVGGFTELIVFINENIIYPSKAIEGKLQGKCYLKFKIDELGNIDNVTVIRGVAGCSECDTEAVKVLMLMPKWIPAKIEDNPVESWFQMPINFILEKEEDKKLKQKKN